MGPIFLFDVPSSAGCLDLGTELLAGHLRMHGIEKYLSALGTQFIDLGSVPIKDVDRHNRPPIRNWPFPKAVWESTSVFLKSRSNSGFFLCLGGDCSIVVGTATGMIDLWGRDKIHILYIDGDVDSIAPDPEKCLGSAGMGLWFLTQESPYWEGPKLSPSQVTVLGNKEMPLTDYGIAYITLENLRLTGISQSIADLLSTIPHDSRLFVHLDVDVLCADEMPAAYAPRPQGLSFGETQELLSLVLADPRSSYLEITEFMSQKDPNGEIARKLIGLIDVALRLR